MKKGKTKIISLIVFIFLLIIPLPSPAQDNPGTPEKLVEELTGFFRDIEARVIKVDESLTTIDRGAKDGIKRYMRFDIVSSRKIKHPVTEEEIGTGDIKTGRIEIIEVEEEYSKARVIEGIAEPGARILLSTGPLRVYVEEEKTVDYFIIEDYLRILRKKGRFEIVNDRNLSDISVVLASNGYLPDGSLGLVQSCLWSDSAQVFLRSETRLSKEYLERIKKDKALYEEELKGSDLLLSFRLPGSVRFLNIADIDGDGRDDLVIARDNSIEVYALGVTLKGLYELKIKGEPLGLYTADTNGDGRAEIIISLLQDEKAYSYIYELREGEFRELFRVEGILRYVNGNLFHQGYSPYDGPGGEIKRLEPLSFNLHPSHLNPKLYADLFSFIFLCKEDERKDPSEGCLTLIEDERGYLNLFDSNGKLIWKSKEDMGGFFTTFKKATSSPLLKEEEWRLRDRFIVEGNRVYLIKRKPVAGVAKGLGWSSSMIISLRWDGKEIIEETIKEVGGAIVDFYLTKDRLYVLQKPFMGISLGSLLKGENPRQTRLYIFKR